MDPMDNGERETGSCVICKEPARKQCQPCLDTVSGRSAPYYCGVEHQREDWSVHKLTCLRTRISKAKKALKRPSRPVDFLLLCIKDDLLPAKDSLCYKPFGFSNCKNTEEESNLLSLYVGLIKILETDLDDIDQAVRKGELAQFICKEYETLRPDPETRGFYFPWFEQNLHILQM